AKTTKLSAVAHLAQGNNEIAVRLSNAWQKEPVLTRKALVIYRRPPRIVDLKQLRISDKPPRVEIQATVETPNDMPLIRARASSWKARADDRKPTNTEIKTRDLTLDPQNAKKGSEFTTWTITGKDIPLDEGTNVVSLVVSNGDGECLEAKSLTVAYTKPPEPKAEV